MKARSFLALFALAATVPTIAQAGGISSEEAAEKRLRGCVLTGSSAAPRTSLSAALASVRAFCGPQIGDLAELRVRAATDGLEDEAAENARKRTIRKLNDEIAYAVANFTGLNH